MQRSARSGRAGARTSRKIRLFGASDKIAGPMALHRVHGLAGGAKLVTAAMPERLSASLVFLFAGGSRLEDERHAGVSHFIEHLFFKGTQKRPTSKEIADAMEEDGGFSKASTAKELTASSTRVPAEHLALRLDVLLDTLSTPPPAPADV